jgi:cytochrome c-type biogenesis protein CcmH
MYLVLLFALGVFTLGADLDSARFEKLGHEMVCICGCNQILLECNHVGCPSSEGMRKELAAAISGGGPDKGILDQFVEKYGPTVLAAPTTTGFGRVAWVMPFVVLIGGIGLVMIVVRNWRLRTAAVSGATPGGLSPEYASELRARAREETEL